MTRRNCALNNISETPEKSDDKKRVCRRTVITNRCLLYTLTAFVWIFRRLIQSVLLALPADARLRLMHGGSLAAKFVRLQAKKLANFDEDEMRKTSPTPTLTTPSPPAAPCSLCSSIVPSASSCTSGAVRRVPSTERPPSTHPCRSVTLKAYLTRDMDAVEADVFDLMDTIGHVTKQEDIFFDVPYGQMKLRISHSAGKDNGELISYKQTNNVGPNFSESRATQVSDTQYLRTTLALSLTELGTITKKRRIYDKENVRICLDDVDGLGCFVDIDIKCDGTGKRPAEELLKQMEDIRNALCITEDQLVPFSYFELMQQRAAEEQQKSNEMVLLDDKASVVNGSNVISSVVCDDGESGISDGGFSEACVG